MFRLLICIFPLITVFASVHSQEKVTFLSEDNLKITADLYLKNYKLPFIILFHEEGSSRGEYSKIAGRLMNLDYNCLAVDLRAGEKNKFTANETAKRAKDNLSKRSYLDSWKDVKASVQYVEKMSSKPLILVGSSFSASLCIMEAADNDNIRAIALFSPGEFFRPDVSVSGYCERLHIPVFLYATHTESVFVNQMFSGMPAEYIHTYFPGPGKGEHGAKVLEHSGESSSECWFELLLFFKKLREE